MYCKNCNKTYLENDRFCAVCGRPLEEKKPIYTPAVSSAALIYKHGSSKLYLAFAILMVVSALANLISLNIQNFHMFRDMKEAGSIFTENMLMHIFTLIAGIFGQILLWVEALGIWMHYYTCRKAQDASTGGLQILQITNICSAIAAIIGTIMVLIVMFGELLSSVGYAYDVIAAVIVIVIAAFALLPILVLFGINYFKVFSAIRKAKKMLKGDKLYKMPLYYIIFNFILVAFGLIVTPISIFAFDGGFWSLITLLPSSAAAVLPAVLMLRFNADIKRAQNASANPAPNAPQSPSEAAASILMQDADEILEAQVDNEETIEDMPQA